MGGVAVPAVRGSCVAFFTRSTASDGAIDPYSWHGGAAVCSSALLSGPADHRPPTADPSQLYVGKWTLQKFRECPVPVPSGGAQEFARQHASLNPGCSGGVRFV